MVHVLPNRRAAMLNDQCFGPRKEARYTYVAKGHGWRLLKRILDEFGWREVAATPGTDGWVVSSRFHLQWSSRIELEPLWNRLQSWQLVNHFSHSAAIGSKAGLLRHLRQFCLENSYQDTSALCVAPSAPQMVPRPLHQVCPRSYDLRNREELRAFILDFAVTRASAIAYYGIRQTELVQRPKIDEPWLARLAAAVQVLGMVTPKLLSRAKAHPTWIAPEIGLHGYGLTDSLGSFGLDALSNFLTGLVSEPPILQAVSEASRQASETDLLAEAQRWLDLLRGLPVRQPEINGEHGFWLLKAPHLNCGRGISTHTDLVPLLLEAQKNNWDMVVQKYVEDPFLLDGRKWDLRLWVLVTSWYPAVVWVHPEPYLRLAQKQFTLGQGGVSDPLVHLTNRAIQKRTAHIGPHSEHESPLQYDEEWIWTLHKFFDWAEEVSLQVDFTASDGVSQKGTVREAWDRSTWPRILQAVRTSVLACQPDACHAKGCFELFGFDFLIDKRMQPWLLEANSSPDLCEDSGPALRALVESKLRDLLRIVVGLQEGTVEIPRNTPTEWDSPVHGSGRWRLCLFEQQCSIKGPRLWRRPRSHTPFGMKSGSSKEDSHERVLQEFLGQQTRYSRPRHPLLDKLLHRGVHTVQRSSSCGPGSASRRLASAPRQATHAERWLRYAEMELHNRGVTAGLELGKHAAAAGWSKQNGVVNGRQQNSAVNVGVNPDLTAQEGMLTIAGFAAAPGAWSAPGMLSGVALLDRTCTASAKQEIRLHNRPKPVGKASEQEQISSMDNSMQRSSSAVLGAGSAMPVPQGSRKAAAVPLSRKAAAAFHRSKSVTTLGSSALGTIGRGRLPR